VSHDLKSIKPKENKMNDYSNIIQGLRIADFNFKNRRFVVSVLADSLVIFPYGDPKGAAKQELTDSFDQDELSIMLLSLGIKTKPQIEAGLYRWIKSR
jgi:hypothetical protein